MTRWFVSRHPGAIAWAVRNKVQIDRWVEHLDPELVHKGDVVMGTLPVHLAAKVCQYGATFYFLEMHLSQQQRGSELTLHEMEQAQCSLLPYMVLPAE